MGKRVFLIVLDSFGIGEMPDAADYGDEGSNTLFSCVRAGAKMQTMARLGLGNIDGVSCLTRVENPIGAYARMTEASRGKDTTTGHWEIAGIVTSKPMPTFPNGFPDGFIRDFEKAAGRRTLCNKPYSGVQVIRDYGREQVEKGALIVYTSADSVFQVAAHTGVVPLKELYAICETAREMLKGELGVGRVIARPFNGEYPFVRTADRHDFSLLPPGESMLNVLQKSGRDVIAVGKINDIFASSGVTEKIITHGNADGLNKTTELLKRGFDGLCFVNLVDFDMLYGHRNNPKGYAGALEEFDQWLQKALPQLNGEDMLMITADHGCDPSTASTDHSREYVPLLVYGKGIKPQNLGTRKSFADIGATVLESFDLPVTIAGESFYHRLTAEG